MTMRLEGGQPRAWLAAAGCAKRHGGTSSAAAEWPTKTAPPGSGAVIALRMSVAKPWNDQSFTLS